MPSRSDRRRRVIIVWRWPRHDIEIEIPPKVVLNSDVRFVVRSDGEKLGELLVSKGSVAWIPGHSPQAIHVGGSSSTS